MAAIAKAVTKAVAAMMGAGDALTVLDALTAAGMDVWLDGGWGVDALLGVQTREHDDLDVVIALDRAANAQRALAALGYCLTEDELPTRFVMRDGADRCVDFHTVSFDAEGGPSRNGSEDPLGGIQRLQDGRVFRYPPEGFTGHGQIAGRAVRCLTPEVQVRCHLGYKPDATDRHDVLLLCRRFMLPVPAPYAA